MLFLNKRITNRWWKGTCVQRWVVAWMMINESFLQKCEQMTNRLFKEVGTLLERVGEISQKDLEGKLSEHFLLPLPDSQHDVCWLMCDGDVAWTTSRWPRCDSPSQENMMEWMMNDVMLYHEWCGYDGLTWILPTLSHLTDALKNFSN